MAHVEDADNVLHRTDGAVQVNCAVFDDADISYAAQLSLDDCMAFEVEAVAAGFELTTHHEPGGATTAKLSGQCILMVTRPTLFGALAALMALWAPWSKPARVPPQLCACTHNLGAHRFGGVIAGCLVPSCGCQCWSPP